MIYFTDEKSKKLIPVETVTEFTGEEVEVILTKDNTYLLDKLKHVKKIAISYFSYRHQNFKRLDEMFFEDVSEPLYNFIKYCEKNDIELLDSTLNKFSILNLFSDKNIVNSPPKKVFVELTKNCNSLCKMCLTRVKNPKFQGYHEELNMDFELFKKIADELFNTADFVDLRGFGESTILPNLDKYLDYALQFKTQFGLITNLSVRNDKLWNKLKENDFLLDVSIDGATKETYEEIRQGLRFENIIYNLKLFDGYKKIALLFTVQKDNISEMQALVKLAEGLNIPEVKFAAVNPSELYEEIYKKYSKDEVKNFFDSVKSNKIKVTWLSKFDNRTTWPQVNCTRPRNYLFINYDGSLSPCNGFLTEQNFGIFKGRWQEFFNTPQFLALRGSLGKPFEFFRCSWCNENRRNDVG